MRLDEPDGKAEYEWLRTFEPQVAPPDEIMADQQLADWLAEWMGWHLHLDEEQHEYVWLTQGNCPRYWQSGTTPTRDIWHPPEDMNQAMMVDEQMAKQDWHLAMGRDFGVHGWWANYRKTKHSSRETVHDDSPARAICLAMKEAIEDDKD